MNLPLEDRVFGIYRRGLSEVTHTKYLVVYRRVWRYGWIIKNNIIPVSPRLVHSFIQSATESLSVRDSVRADRSLPILYFCYRTQMQV